MKVNSLFYFQLIFLFTVTANDKQISSSQYKLRNKTDEQARLFPELEKEIAERRARLHQPTRDQGSEKYKDEI